MSFDVAQLNAHLQAEVAGFLRNLEAADTGLDSTERHIRGLERVAREASLVLNEVKISSAQAFESRAALETIERSVGGVSAAALIAADRLHDVKVTQAQAAESKVATSEIKDQLDGVIVKAEAARIALSRVNGRGGGVGGGGGAASGGLLAGALPGGARATPGALAVLAALGLSTLPTIAPAGLGLAAGGANLGLGLAGGAGVLFGALHGISSKSFSDKKSFDALDPAQKQLVQDLRSLSAGLGAELSKISQTILPHLSAELHAAFSPTTTVAITNDVHAFADATSQVADMWGKFLGGPFGTELGGLLQHDAQYLVPLNDELMNMLDFLVQVLQIGTPFTDWLSNSIQIASQGANAWAHSARGVHDLGVAFDQGQAGLESLSHLLGGLFDILGAVYQVTENGANPAIDTLAGFLREVAAIISDNRGTLSAFFEGGVGAAHDLLGVIDALRPVLKDTLTVIDDIAGGLGGWNTVIDGAAVFWVARMIAIRLGIDGVLGKILLIGPETASSTAEADAALQTLVVAANEAAAALAGLGPAAVEGTAVADAAIAGTAASATAAAGEVGGLRAAQLGLGGADVLGALAAAAIPAAALYAFLAGQGQVTEVAGGGHVEIVDGKPILYKPGYRKGIPLTPAQYNSMVGSGANGADRSNHDPNAAPTKGYYQQLAASDAARYGVPSALFTNQINQESGFSTSAHSSAGAIGIAQFIPGTAAGLGVNPNDPTSSLAGAAKLMRSYYNKYHRWDFALAAYNGGPGAVDYYLKHGYYPTKETTNYVDSILSASGIPIGAEPGSTPFGTPPPFPPGTPPAKKGVPTGLSLLPTDLATALTNAQAAAAGFGSGTGSGSGFTDPAKTIAAERGVVNAAQDALDFLNKQKATGKELVNISRERLALEKEIASATKVIHSAQLQQQHDATAAKERGILGLDSSGAAATPGVLSLRSQAKAMASELTKAAGEGLDVTDATATLAKLQRVLKFNFIPPDVRAAVANQIAALKQTVGAGMSQLLDTAKQNLSDATSSFESGFSSAITAADQQFEQNVSNAANALQILVHGPFGDFLFGGNIKSTPAGKALSDLTDTHTLQGLNKNLKDAQDAVSKAQGGDGRIFDFATGLTTTTPGDQQSLLDAQQQLADAQFALDQYNLGKQSDAEQSAANDQLSAAQDAYTKQQRLVETAMDQQVAAIEAGIESGKITADEGLKEIEKIWAAHGIDLEAISFALGGQIYTGLSQGLQPIFDLLKTLIDDLNRVRDLSGLPPVGGDGGYVAPNQFGTLDPAIAAFLGIATTPISGADAFRLLNPPGMAGGGYVPPTPGGSIRRLAEAGKGEFVIPEDKMGGGGVHITVPIAGDVYTMDADEFARKIAPAIREQLILTNRSTTSLFG